MGGFLASHALLQLNLFVVWLSSNQPLEQFWQVEEVPDDSSYTLDFQAVVHLWPLSLGI